MINVSPIGRNASTEERNEYQKYDIEHDIRPTMVRALKEAFPDYGLTYSIGGQISFDVFPTGWDKTYCLNFIAKEKERTIGHSVKNPDDTFAQLQELLKSFQQQQQQQQ
jgi:phosphomannomutase